ncbi:MAG TPA: SMP-30/gluconolactonase/LRE family protein [Polyangiaceae bacterium]|jgi:hypothetical protein
MARPLVGSLAFAWLLGCSSAASPPGSSAAGAPAGTAGATGASGSGGATLGAAGSSGQASSGSPGSAGSAGSGAGAGVGGSSAGSGGSAGSAGGDQGGAAGAAAGAAGAGPVGFWGPNGPKKQWSCPPGPFPTQVKGPATDICNSGGFKYNYTYNEGPTWIASQNAFFFSNFIQGSSMGGDIIKYPMGGTCEVWVHDVGCNGLGVSPSGNLLASCHGPRSVMEYDVMTKKGRVIAAMANGKMLDAPNDLIARSDGNVYFSNTIYELGGRPQGLGNALVRVDPTGLVTVVQPGGLNGMALSPDEKTLYVVEMGTFPLDASGLPGKNAGNAPGGDGIAMDCAGTISITGTNSAFGGTDGKTLIAAGPNTDAKIYQMTVPGLP